MMSASPRAMNQLRQQARTSAYGWGSMSTLGGLLYRKNEGRESQISTNAQERVHVHRQESPGLAENQVCRWLGAAEIYTEVHY